MLHTVTKSTRRLLVAVLAIAALLALSATAVLGDENAVSLEKEADNGGALVEPGGALTYTLTATVSQAIDSLTIGDGSLDPGQYLVDNATYSIDGGAPEACAFLPDDETNPDVECVITDPIDGSIIPVEVVVTIAGYVNTEPDEACPDRGDGTLDTNMTNRGEANWTQDGELGSPFTVIDPPMGESAVNVGIDCSEATPAARPETTIESGPEGTVSSTSADFAFTATNTPTSFECMLDSGGWEACTSPKSYTSLTEGSHTFQVRGINLAGPDETPASRTWTVDTGSPPPPPPPDHPFTDIDGNQFENDIIWLYDEGITGGCTTTLFCPSSNVLRDQMASFLDRALDLPPTAIDFFDDDDGNIHEGAINRLAAAGITGGCDVREYCPKASVKRDQMASFLVRAFKLPLTATDFFGDDEGNLHENQINALANSGITGGCGPGRYCPTNPVTRGQMAAFLHRASD